MLFVAAKLGQRFAYVELPPDAAIVAQNRRVG